VIRSSLKLASCLVPVALAAMALPADAAVTLDTTFAPVLNAQVNAIVIDGNGRIVFGGQFSQPGTQPQLARFQPSGVLDDSFAGANLDGPVTALAIDSTGRIVVGGNFTSVGGGTHYRIARLASTGLVDTSFTGGLNNSAFGLAIDGSDNVVVVGEFARIGTGSTLPTSRQGLARFTNAGAPDTSLSVDPALSFTVPVRSVAIDSQGRMVVVGDFSQAGVAPNNRTRNRIARFAVDGTLDTGFNPDLNGNTFSVAIDGNDKIVIAGEFTAVDGGGTWREGLARLNEDGTADTSFADPQITGGAVYSLKIDQNGRIVVGGAFTSAGGQSYAKLARFTAAGALDTSFVPPSFSGGTAAVNALTIDSDGRIVIGGDFTQVGGQPRTYAARLIENVTLSIAKAGAGSGTVTASAGGLSCGSTCSGPVAIGTSVTLTATADSGSAFTGWSGDCNGAATTSAVTMSADRTCTATFGRLVPPPPPVPPTPVNVPSIDTTGSAQGTLSVGAALGNPGPGATFTVQQTSGAPLPNWLTFNPATLSFSYDVPLPSDLPVQPAADVRAGRGTIPNRVYPLSVLVQTVPVLLTMTSGGATSTYSVNMTFYAPRSPSVMTAVSYSPAGRSGDGTSGRPVLSWDGGQLLFETAANNLFSATSAHTKIGRYDGLSGNRDLLSQTAIPGGGVANAANGAATAPAVSANGSWGAFAAAGGGVTITPNSPLKQVYRTSLVYPRVPLNEAATPAPTMVSATPAGVPANAAADNPAISENGGLVAFESAATNLGANAAGVVQIWRKDLATGAMVLVSSSAGGTAGNGDSRNVSLSWDGRFAAFESTATNLVLGASGNQVYLKDMQTGAVFVIGLGSRPKLDARADSLVFSNGGQVMRFERATGRVTTIASGDQPGVSADGRFIVWRQAGTAFTQVWVRDVMRGQSALVSQTSAGSEGSGNSYDPAISGDGGTIGFGSQARDLVNGNPLPGQIHVAANPLLLPARTDYWYVTTGGNQAWAIERWGDQAYVANLAYQPGGGVATWTAGLCRFEGLVCRGSLQNGMSIVATFDANGTTASLTVNGGAAQSLALYPILGPSTTGYAGLPQGGWWYEPGRATANNGVFLAFDTQVGANGAVSQTAHLTLLTYDTAGVPVWYAAEGVLGSDLSLEGTLMRYAGGAAIGTTTGGVAPSSAPVGAFRLSFGAGDRATLRLPDGRIADLGRFRF